MGESETVIRVENVSKKYVIGHQKGDRPDSLRELLTAAPRRLVRSLFGRTKEDEERVAAQEEFWALKDVSFEVKRGEVVGIIGRNGAGKSTLLKLLSRITEPTSGRIEIDGRVASLLEVGTGFHGDLTGRENVYLNGSVLGMTRKEINRKFDEIVAFAEVEKFLDTPVKRYSSGMYVRLAFAIAAHLEPEVLIVDEVLAVGDTQFQQKCMGKLREVSHDGRTILFVSHNMAALQNICQRGIGLQLGKVSCDTDIATAIRRHLSNETALELASIEWADVDLIKSRVVTLRRAAVLNDQNEVSSVLTCQDPFKVSIDYDVSENVRGLVVGFDLRNRDDILVCGSNSDGLMDAHSIGRYRMECRFPGDLLNEGRYSFAFILHTPDGKLIDTDPCIMFDVKDTKGHGSNHIKVHGILRPNLKWAVSESSN